MSIARKPRIWYPGAKYHVVNRGNHSDDIFWEEEDYLEFLKILEITGEQHPFSLLSFCLMSNHIHLQLETKEEPIWEIMKAIKMDYTRYYNKKYSLSGHLFQGRYGSKIIEDVYYLLESNRYIHQNPVRAQMVSRPEEYPWSSYGIYVGMREWNFLQTQEILDCFKNGSRNLYREFIEKGV
ncbi:transposase [Parasporobacterium paucivorans]|uniref:REP element-mobilizing transposase RayT n=1 Tax=Parasporobacterium paucivorans DSM 15970 TaxID=1122934 RepID=A0A1M6GSW9_9FIRM|nr:transposase [Parasporobacterium paucivorans]SHJ13026.1 REP element-mobilizing transposase RayT [Parasporobacterium paucivorans DSM 15970]